MQSCLLVIHIIRFLNSHIQKKGTTQSASTCSHWEVWQTCSCLYFMTSLVSESKKNTRFANNKLCNCRCYQSLWHRSQSEWIHWVSGTCKWPLSSPFVPVLKKKCLLVLTNKLIVILIFRAVSFFHFSWKYSTQFVCEEQSLRHCIWHQILVWAEELWLLFSLCQNPQSHGGHKILSSTCCVS